MNQKQVIAHMTSELDWYAREYEKYTDAEVKEEIANEFRQHAKAYNALLGKMYKKVSRVHFTRRIERHIEQRNGENWS